MDAATKRFEDELTGLIERHGATLNSDQVITVLERALDEALVIAGETEASKTLETLRRAAAFATPALAALEGFEADYGEPVPDGYELGRIEASRATPSFRLQAGHIRMLAAAIRQAVR